MKRTVWLALSFLTIIGALVAFKVSIATPAKQQAAFADMTMGANTANQDEPLAKADKLDVSYVDEAPDKNVVRLIPIGLPTSAQPEPREKFNKIVSRHWHEGYAKTTKRSPRNRRVASKATK
jgi:hypothetical protein